VVGDVEPSQRRACPAVVRAAMPPMPEAVAALGLLPTFGDQTGIADPGLCMVRRDHVADRRLVEGDKGKVSGVPPGKGPCVIRPVAAEIAQCRVAWEHQPKSQQMCQKLLVRLLGVASHGQYPLSQSHGGSPFSVVLDNTTLA